jgi:CheY-like chemotaxis protein
MMGTMSADVRSSGAKRLLIADDEPMMRRFVKMILEQQGHEVTAVEDGKQALETARTGAYDGIVLDIMMPYMTGIEVLQRLRLEPETRDTFVVLLTGQTSEDEVNEGLWHGANLYITKPFNPSDLANVFGHA